MLFRDDQKYETQLRASYNGQLWKVSNVLPLSYSILHNGKPTNDFKQIRGLH